MKVSTLRKNLRNCTLDGLFATPAVFLYVPGNIIMAALLTSVFSIPEGPYGLIVSLPFWCNALQAFFMPLLSQKFSARTISLGFGWAYLACWFILTAALPFLPQDDAKLTANLLLLLLGMVTFFGSITGVGWTAWVQEFVPRRIRGKYFGFRNRVLSLMTMSFLYGAGWFIDKMEDSLRGYVMLFAAAGGLRIFGFICQHRVKAGNSHGDKPSDEGLFHRFKLLKENKAFLRFVIFGGMIVFLFNFTGPFGPVFMYEHLMLTVSDVTTLSVIGALMGAFSWPIWGALCDKYGCKPVMFLSIICWELQNYFWVILTPENSWLLYPMWFWGGLTSTGFFIGNFNFLLKLVPIENKTTAISLNLAITSLAGAASPILAGYSLGAVDSFGLDKEMAYRIGFFVKSTLVLSTLLYLRSITEPEEHSMRNVLGALRSVRHILQLSGLPLFTNIHVSRETRNRPKRP